MLTETIFPCDGATLAQLVRDVGLSARRSLNRPPDFAETSRLLRAIDSLETELIFRPSGDLSRWLSSLRRRIEAHLVPVA